MGWWGTDEITIGDDGADIMDKAATKITKVYRKELGRDPTIEELIATLKFVFPPPTKEQIAEARGSSTEMSPEDFLAMMDEKSKH